MSKTQLNFRQPPNLPELERSIQDFWQKDDTFKKSVDQRSPDNAYVFYDGPPFATGLPHYGHLLGSTSKDVIPRYQTMRGKRVERVWGWDCHGLPIENMMEKQLKIEGGKKGIEQYGIGKFNAACRAEVLRLDTEWERIIGRLGRWVDFANNYKTMDDTYMESVWWGFAQMYTKGLVYEGRKVILYCPRCSTPLSNFEIAMDNSYLEVTDSGTTYKYAVIGKESTFLLAWSTTPWNKLATPALAVNPGLQYVRVKQGDQFYVLAETTLPMLGEEPYTVIEKIVGKDLADWRFEPHYDFYAADRSNNEKFGVVIADDFVTADEGTGIVTLAVYGEDDYRVMKQHGIQLVEHVDEEGKLKPEVQPWGGMDILESNAHVNADLAARGLVYSDHPHTHSVATCYRCSTRLYYAPLPAWFIDVQKLKEDLLKLNEGVNWFPDHLKHGRFKHGIESAPDWNVSRSRYWGTPMPIWKGVDAHGKQQLRVVGSIAELKQWAVDAKAASAVTDLHREFLDDLEVWVDDAKTVKGTRIPEVFDCWVESGSMPFASVHYPFENKVQFEATYPAQFISEYIAQTRAWFYTMHVISTGVFGKTAFENVLTTGTILAEDGSKMSKSKKNYPDPALVMENFGVDSLRLYLMSSPVMRSENLNFSEKEVGDIRRKVFVVWWNVLGFFQQFADTSVAVTEPPKNATHVMDRWLLSAVQTLIADVTQAMDAYDVVKASRLLIEFVNTLSTWYLRLSRERLRAVDNAVPSQVLGYSLYVLAQLFSPLAPFFAEVVHQTLVDDATSIHLSLWPREYKSYVDAKLQEDMILVQKVVEIGHAARKAAGVKVRQPLATLSVAGATELPGEELLAVIRQELNVKAVVLTSDPAVELTASFDMVLTPELVAEGKARELARSIQQLRKDSGLQPGELAEVTVTEIPEGWQEFIETKTSSTLKLGAALALREH